MARYEETQRYHQPLALGLLALFSMLAVVRLGQSFVETEKIGLSILLVLILGGAWYYIRRLKCTVKVGKKKIKIYAPGSLLGRKKVAYKDIEQIEFVTFSEAEMWSGGRVNYTPTLTTLDFGDRRGMHITLKNGQEYCILSNDLYENRDRLGLPKELIVN